MTTRGKKIAGHPGFGGVGDAFTASPGPRVAFAVSNYTQIPNAVIDEYMAGLTGAEFKVLAYIARRTFGFHRESARVSAAQLAGGLVGRDGRQLDCGTGLSRTQVFAAVKGLEARGLIAVRRTGNVGGKATESNTYTLWVQGAADAEPVMGDEWAGRGTVARVELVAPAPPRTVSALGGGFNNRTAPRAKNAPPYRVGKKGGKKAPLSPMKNGKENGTQPPTPAKCPACSGFGLLDIGARICAPHVGTLEEVNRLVDEWGARYCDCPVGQGWRALVEDAAKGDGPRKGVGAGKVRT